MSTIRSLALLLVVCFGIARAQPAAPEREPGALENDKAGDGNQLGFAEYAREATATKPPKPVIELPELENWTHSELRALPPKDHGFSVAYDHPSGVTVTLYQFTRGLGQIPDDLRSEPVKNEMKGAKSGIHQAVQMGLWQSAKEEDSGVVRLGDSPKQALWSRHVVVIDGDEATSDTYVWAHNNALFKTRCTFETRYTDGEAAAKILSELLTALGNACRTNTEP
jgi:hypothetical protein